MTALTLTAALNFTYAVAAILVAMFFLNRARHSTMDPDTRIMFVAVAGAALVNGIQRGYWAPWYWGKMAGNTAIVALLNDYSWVQQPLYILGVVFMAMHARPLLWPRYGKRWWIMCVGMASLAFATGAGAWVLF